MDLIESGYPKLFAGTGEGYGKNGFWHTTALISLKHGKIGPWLLLRSNRKSNMLSIGAIIRP